MLHDAATAAVLAEACVLSPFACSIACNVHIRTLSLVECACLKRSGVHTNTHTRTLCTNAAADGLGWAVLIVDGCCRCYAFAAFVLSPLAAAAVGVASLDDLLLLAGTWCWKNAL